MPHRFASLTDFEREEAQRSKLRWLLVRYVIALGLILSFLLISHIASTAELRRAAHDATAVNMSGRQRMLLQRIAHAAHDYAEIGQEDRKDLLASSVAHFADNHDRLVNVSQKDKLLKDLYFKGSPSLNQAVKDIVASANRVVETPDAAAADLARIEAHANGDMADRLDAAVSAFESAALHRSMQLKRIQDLTLLVAVLTILGEIAFIFWPSHRAVIRSFQILRNRQKTTEIALTRLSNFAALAADLFWETDGRDGSVIYAEGKFLDRLKGGRSNIVGCRYTDIIQLSDEDLSTIQHAIETAGSYAGVRGIFTDTDGVRFNIEIAGVPRRDKEGNVVGYLGTANDVTEIVRSEQQVIQLAYQDPLTSLANMREFDRIMPAMLATASADATTYLMALDLDGFKAVNDTYGHGAGDEVLKHVAKQMTSVVRDTDVPVRIGGDEFLIVCASVPSEKVLLDMTHRLNECLSAPVELANGKTVRVSASIGVACAPTDATNLHELCRAADIALYSAKRSGRNQTHFYRNVAQQSAEAVAS